MKKGIIFDKDGTLIELDSVWYKIVAQVMEEIFEKYPREKKKKSLFFEAIGMKDNEFNNLGLLASQTNRFIAEKWFLLLGDTQIEKSDFIQFVIELFKKHSTSDGMIFKEIKGASETLAYLKSLGYLIQVVTSDDIDSAIHSLKTAGLYDYVDLIGAEDGINRPKPNSDFFHLFKEKFQLMDRDIIMVGDTLIDIEFARNCNIKVVGVLSGACKIEDLEDKADYIINSVRDITKVLVN